VDWWGPTTVKCPFHDRRLAKLVACRIGFETFGVVEDDPKGSWSEKARWDAGKGVKSNPRFRVEIRGWWAVPKGFFFCPTCRKEQYGLQVPTPRAEHRVTGDPHPGFTTEAPELEAYAVFRCRPCRHDHVVGFREIGEWLFENDGPWPLPRGMLLREVPAGPM
jgi:hypothetical protein